MKKGKRDPTQLSILTVFSRHQSPQAPAAALTSPPSREVIDLDSAPEFIALTQASLKSQAPVVALTSPLPREVIDLDDESEFIALTQPSLKRTRAQQSSPLESSGTVYLDEFIESVPLESSQARRLPMPGLSDALAPADGNLQAAAANTPVPPKPKRTNSMLAYLAPSPAVAALTAKENAQAKQLRERALWEQEREAVKASNQALRNDWIQRGWRDHCSDLNETIYTGLFGQRSFELSASRGVILKPGESVREYMSLAELQQIRAVETRTLAELKHMVGVDYVSYRTAMRAVIIQIRQEKAAQSAPVGRPLALAGRTASV